MLTKLDFVAPSTYNIPPTSKRDFVPEPIASEYLAPSFDFAFNMSFGNAGHHRNHRTGGSAKRKNGEIFVNAFQGKVAEFVFYDWLKKHGITTSLPDVTLMGKGLWDDSDFTVNGKKISIKSAAYFSNLMLLETQDWNHNGDYIPNMEMGNASYNYFVLIRVKPDGKKLMKDSKLYYADKAERITLKRIFASEKWSADLVGFATKDDLQMIIANKHIIPQGGLLNGRIPMDASNYYFQSNDLRGIGGLINLL
ncbi:hypothetical protein [Pedobacter arcticus]|uniref:hypothetical protein n=1 Tax=Pedobacter arcticus TaxID=752140 RepID=UPI00030ACC76|nr:hypothetical protein [Pedobacter arcticus]